VPTAETFKVMKEIVICWLLSKHFVATSNRGCSYNLLIVIARAKWIAITNVVQYISQKDVV